jgi:hypothetical protein
MPLLEASILWPKRLAGHFEWAGPLVARIVVGYPFMLTGLDQAAEPGEDHPGLR